MKVSLASTPWQGARPALVVLPVSADPVADAEVRKLDRRAHDLLVAEIERRGFRGGADEDLVFQTHGTLPADWVVLVGCGALPAPERWYRIADLTATRAAELRARSAAVVLARSASPAAVEALVEGVALARYRFDRFRSTRAPALPLDFALAVERVDSRLRAAAARGETVADATCFARDLANTPGADLPPLGLARAARALAAPGLTVRVRSRRALERLGMGAILGVAQGSVQEPVLVELAWRPRQRPRRRVALVGKGVTFDSGGLSLKNPDAMQPQKRDMAGAAVVLGVMRALPRLRPPIEVRGYLPCAENMPSGSAMRPGDVLRACNDKTIEVLNTDAEGRLVLADALSYAVRHKPDVLLDFATLTAAVRTALGTRCAAVMATDAALARACIRAGAEVGERLWELPLIEEYRKDLDSRVADLKNIGEAYAGTIVGGLFLREFVGDVPWAHIDFSSTVMSDGYPCHPKGASGFGVRTALRLLRNLAAGPIDG